jgi:hypothetical protein
VQLSFGPIGWLMISEVVPVEAARPWTERCCSCEFCIQCTGHLCFLSIGGTNLSCCYCHVIGVLYFYLQDVNDMKLVVNNCTVCTLL